jgi:hypothetical protein
MFGSESNHTLRIFLNRACVSSVLMQNADKKFGKGQTKGMGQPLSQHERFLAPFESLVRVAELPQSPGRVCESNHPGLSSGIVEQERPMALRIIDGDRVFQMFPDRNELAHPVRDHSPGHLRVYQ